MERLCDKDLARGVGFEPTLLGSQSSRVTITRTQDIIWCSEIELNYRHGDFQSPALPTELSKHMVQKVGIEPT